MAGAATDTGIEIVNIPQPQLQTSRSASPYTPTVVADSNISKDIIWKFISKQHGKSSNAQKEAILNALGGIDSILKKLWSSDAIIHQNELQSLSEIFNKADCKKSGSKVKKSIDYNEDGRLKSDYSFKDSEVLLRICLPKQKCMIVYNALTSNITKAILAITFFLFIVVVVLLNIGYVPSDIGMIYWSLFLAIFAIYCTLWLLFVNTKAFCLMKQEFEFLFKAFYLFTYLVAYFFTDWLEGLPMHYYIVGTWFDLTLLMLTMLTDAVNMKQTTKIIIQSIALASFAYTFCRNRQIISSNAEVYELCEIEIPNYFGIGSIRFNIADIGYNSSQILFFFSFKQMFASMRRPNCASVIKIYPMLIYENKAKSTSSAKQWKWGSIILWISIFALFCLWHQPLSDVHHYSMIMFVMFLALILFAVLMLFVDRIKCVYAAIFVILFSILCYTIGTVLFGWYAVGVALLFWGFSLSAIYSVKVSESDNEIKEKLQDMIAKSKGNLSVIDVPSDNKMDRLSPLEQMDKTPQSVEIELKNIHNSTMWDNIDRQESIEANHSILSTKL